MNVVIVEDEVNSRMLLRNLLMEIPKVTIVGEAATVAEAKEVIGNTHPDLLFLDIQLQNSTSFELLQQLEQQYEIIFTTAYDEYAVKAFKFNAIDYLLKPIDEDELKLAVQKAEERISSNYKLSKEQVTNLLATVSGTGRVNDKIAIPTPDGFIVLPCQDILYCRSIGNYTEFVLVHDKKLMSSYTLKQYDDILSNHGFLRIHKSYLVNLKHIVQYKRTDGGSVVLANGDEIAVSKRNKEVLLEAFRS
jgi:two-component system LytT family response regulator